MANFTLKGHVSYAVGRKYKWIAEFGKNTCEQCSALDGQEFEEGGVPFWPHPNCRCKVEEISVIDEIESEMNEYKEEIKQLKLQANELLGDTSVLREQIKQAIKESQSKEADSLESKLSRVEYEIYQLIDKIEALTRDTIDKYVIARVERQMDEFNNCIQQYSDKFKKLEKKTINEAVNKLKEVGPDAVALYKLASSGFTQGTAYIKKNGKICDKIADLNNKKLEKAVITKVQAQLKRNDSRGIVLNKNSSLAQDIVKSVRFKSYINDNLEKLIKNKRLQDDNLTFWPIGNANINIFGSVHRCSIINVRLENSIIRAEIIDTIDYNEGEITVATFRYLQETGQLENCYVVIELEIPLSEFQK